MTTTPEPQWDVAAFYCFAPLDDLPALRERLLALAGESGMCGTTLIAAEGFNGTMAAPRRAEAPSGSTPASLAPYLAELRRLAGNHHIELKFSHAADKPFKRLKVRLKREIVTMGVDGIDPERLVGAYVAPKDWNSLIEAEDVVVVDTRNSYETAIGTFEGAIDPATPTFRDFPAWVEANRPLFEGKRIAMFCTGGIRCEKATAYMKQSGFDEVYHLRGGILQYLEDVPEAESLWKGQCFVFDERVALGHGLREADIVPCPECGTPIVAETFEAGQVPCPDCAREGLRAERDRKQQEGHSR